MCAQFDPIDVDAFVTGVSECLQRVVEVGMYSNARVSIGVEGAAEYVDRSSKIWPLSEARYPLVRATAHQKRINALHEWGEPGIASRLSTARRAVRFRAAAVTALGAVTWLNSGSTFDPERSTSGQLKVDDHTQSTYG